MVVHTLQCSGCNEKQIGRDTSDGITPIQETCPNCGETSYKPLAAKRSD
jgi:predicted RNA-binding Zn-ribbon protein involved in translation (DUF1610 family)